MALILLTRVLFSLLSLVILAGAAYLGWLWYEGMDVQDASGIVLHTRGPLWWFVAALGLLVWSFVGRSVSLMLIPKGTDDPKEQRGVGAYVSAPDGSQLYVEEYGLKSGPTLVLTHGWGLDSTAWWYAKRDLATKFRIVVWDLPGQGCSTQPTDGRYTIDRMAQSLGAVVASIDSGPVILGGHSIGGMVTQTFWRAAPTALRERVVGLVLINTTYRNPLHTMWLSPLWLALRWPFIEPMIWLQWALSPLYWISNWQSYMSGSMQISTRLTSFGRFATRGQVNFAARLCCEGSPGVQAKGDLAMFRWDVLADLPSIDVPVLAIAGTRDIITVPGASERIVQAAPHARIVLMDGCGHLGMLERADAYNDAISIFAQDVFADGNGVDRK